jgi:DNA-binding transcriptional regulator YiaG
MPVLPAMTAEEFRAALDGLGLSQIAAAEALDVDPRSVRRWATGERSIPGPVRVALRLMAASAATTARPITSTT